MKRLLSLIASRALPPLVIGFFLILYIGLAFFTEDTLTALIALSSRNILLAGLFALLPLNSLCRMALETRAFLARRRALDGCGEAAAGAFDETVQLPLCAPLGGLEARLKNAGYRTRAGEGRVAGWRGLPLFPARLLFLAATFCLFAGILLSLTGRASLRSTVIEGEAFPLSQGAAQTEKIVLAPGTGAILEKQLKIVVASGEGKETFGLYPPARYQDAFVYPRYLAVGLAVRFTAPDLPTPMADSLALSLYPAGKEASAEVRNSAYRLVCSMIPPEDGSDPYVTGKMSFSVKVQRGSDIVLSGAIAQGGALSQGGYRLELSDVRRLVITDFIKDRGVTLIWTSMLLFLLSLCLFLPVRIFMPRREMLFTATGEGVVGSCRAEGRGRTHTGVFHELLDLLGAGRGDGPAVTPPAPEQ